MIILWERNLFEKGANQEALFAKEIAKEYF